MYASQQRCGRPLGDYRQHGARYQYHDTGPDFSRHRQRAESHAVNKGEAGTGRNGKPVYEWQDSSNRGVSAAVAVGR